MADSSSSEQKQKILVVEDEPLHADMYAWILKEEGFDPVIAMTGDEGLELARKLHPAAILLDIILPGLSGFAVLEQLRADTVTKDIPVLIATNLGSSDAKVRGESLGAALFIVKAHSTPREIVTSLKDILGEKIQK